MNVTFFIIAGVIAIAILGYVLKMRGMPEYKIFEEKDESDGLDKWFVKVRKGMSYYYLEQTMDPPGFVDDKFALHEMQYAGQETLTLAKNVVTNHKMASVDGIEIEGE